jgi:bifunctional oligoribonuclease and PAP phosphatase NrnA
MRRSTKVSDDVRYDAPDWDRIVEVLAASSKISLGAHVTPDGDALGALLGMSLGLRKLDKKTWATWGTSPVQIPYAYEFLPGSDALVDPSELPDDAELFVALDCGSLDRLGDAEDFARRASTLVNIDHHPGNTDFGHLNLVVTEASSTAELVTYLLLDLGVELDRDIATCLYTGVVTDTGRFQYTNSTPDTLRLAADLLGYGVPAPEIAREVFESSPFSYLKLVGRVLDRAQLEGEARFVYSWIDQMDLAEAGISMSEILHTTWAALAVHSRISKTDWSVFNFEAAAWVRAHRELFQLDETGRPEVVSGDEEALLSFTGATRDLGPEVPAAYLVVDIGGGSTEFVYGTGEPEAARSLDIGLVAEGVEHAWQAEYVCARHCAELQGYFFSRPVPPQDVPAALALTYTVPRAISASAAIHSGASLRQLTR